MRAFRSLAIVQFSRDRVWPAMRDALPDIASRLGDIRSITRESRTNFDDGSVLLVNRWESLARVPDAVAQMIGAAHIAWLDKARWSPDGVCSWEIEPSVLADRIACSGRTTFERAMGGRGTRVVLEGSFTLRSASLLAPGADGAVSSAIEFLASRIIPRNFQQVTRAVAEWLERG